jgi:signal peptidase
MNDEKTHVFRHRIGNIFGIAVCIILLPILIVNITLIIKSYLNSDEVPSVGGYLPLIVLSDSMNPLIESGDLIICHTAEAEDVAKGDIIAFIDPAGDGTSVVSHRVTAVIDEDGALSFRTQGDANNTEDELSVPAENVLGIYQRNIPGAGDVAMFLQTTNGLIVCVVIPLVLLVGYDLIRRRLYEKNQKSDKDALLQELEQLRAEKEAAGGDDADVIPESGVAMEATISPDENGSSSEEPVSPSFVPRRRTE